jgi:hypothetical protein
MEATDSLVLLFDPCSYCLGKATPYSRHQRNLRDRIQGVQKHQGQGSINERTAQQAGAGAKEDNG